MSQRKTTTTKRPAGWEHGKASLFGVRYIWEKPARNFWQIAGPGYFSTIREITEIARPFIIRQKRRLVTYWDVLTAFERGYASRMMETNTDRQLLWLVMECIRTDHLDKRVINELFSHRQLRSARTQHCPWPPPYGGRRGEDQALARTHPGNYEIDERGHARPGSNVFVYRQFELDVGRFPRSAERIKWPHLLVLGAMLHLRADLEIFFETGLMRIRCCQRQACRGWFTVGSMATKKVFCSDSCRVMLSREVTR